MKKMLTICTLVAVLVGLVIAAPQAKTTQEPTTTVSVAPVTAADSPEMAAKLEIQSLIAEISAAKAAGRTPDPTLMARLYELLPSGHRTGSLDQGGEDIANATVIPSLPYTDLGSTAAAVNDYDEVCSYTGSTSPDVVYSYLCPTNEVVTIDLCPSSYDTKVYVYENTYTPGFPYACNDDFCPGYQSYIANLSLTGGNTYYVVVDGYGTASGDYSLTITPPPPPAPGEVCATAIPITGFPFSVVGQTTNGFANDYAPTCMSYYGTGVDVVYTFTLTAATMIRIDLTNTGSYAYPGVGLFAGCPDVGTCVAYAFSSTGDLHIPCTLLNPGQYFILVDNWPTPNFINYDLAVDVCQPCDAPVNDNCANALPIVVNGAQVCATTECSTLDCPQHTIAEVWYMFETSECMDLAVGYCGTTTSGNLNAVLYSGSCCGTQVGFSSYEYDTCEDGLITLHFNRLAPGAYWLPVGFTPAGPFCVQVTGTPCCEIVDYCLTPIVLPPVYHYEQTVNTCCATNPVATVFAENCGVTPYASGPDVVFSFCADPTLTITVTGPGSADEQIMVFTDCTDPAGTCVGTRDYNAGDVGGEVLSGLSLPLGCYYISVSYYGEAACGDLTIMIDSDFPLDVNLSNFDAVAGDNLVDLNWTTASERHNARFDVVRNGETVAEITATNHSSGDHYSWTDRNVVNGTTYAYSLVAVDVNGGRQELASESATPLLGAAVISEYALHQNYPNPFNPETQITFDLVDAGNVSLKVFNLMGQEVATVVHNELSAGRHIVSFNGANLPSGLYLYRLNVNGFSAEHKMLLMK